ncbi:E3 ubiquitin-protein ligase PDZRN3-B-like [Dermacentor albipictus]|uniref:E3 ubiquitin-protein ligase PDZRN3-B-like n=1 Tax=Dermacentor albipictus TaxID=60249 RepID=UPI0031FDE320
MPHHEQGRLYRFRDHAVAGVNWRPTRFVGEVPNSRVCGLCRMIPKRMLLLPCGHGLCHSCHAAISQAVHPRCPLDQEPFKQVECHSIDFAARNRSLKVYCWNEEHGCEHMGTLDRMLEHYEKECTFHTMECLRCGEEVQHRDLPTHYAAGCTARASSAIRACRCSEPAAMALADDIAALQDLNEALGRLSDQLLPVMQSQLNELAVEVGNQEARLAVITRKLVACEQNLKGEIAAIAAKISSTRSHQLTSQQNPAEEARTSSPRSLRSGVAMALGKLQYFAKVLIVSFIITKAITLVIYTHE